MSNDFISFLDLSKSELRQILRASQELERSFGTRSMPPLLQGKRIAVIWDGEGFRNRVAFELGIRLMGGELVEVPYSFGAREDAADVASYLDNWFDAVIVRTPSHEALEAFAAAASIPVINARTRHNHPCEVLGDLAYVHAQRGNIEGLKVVYVGQPANLCHSWLEAAAAMPIAVTNVCPPGYEPDASLLRKLRDGGMGTIKLSADLATSVKEADVIYTDAWPAGSDIAEQTELRRAFLPYQISAAVLDRAPSHAIFLPCPPVHRGEEVSGDAMTSSRCKVYEAKAYLLHAQNSLLAHLLRS
jgi:ornithine carbamoyltransferase